MECDPSRKGAVARDRRRRACPRIIGRYAGAYRLLRSPDVPASHDFLLTSAKRLDSHGESVENQATLVLPSAHAECVPVRLSHVWG